MYFLKTQGTDKVTDYIEIRDDNFSLVFFIKLSDAEKKLPIVIEKYGLKTPLQEIVQIINETPFGKIAKIE